MSRCPQAADWCHVRWQDSLHPVFYDLAAWAWCDDVTYSSDDDGAFDRVDELEGNAIARSSAPRHDGTCLTSAFWMDKRIAMSPYDAWYYPERKGRSWVGSCRLTFDDRSPDIRPAVLS
jgi:hypothetical protein